ncbi:MAG: hypothetical protein SFT91_00900 [Rickettsiaceae bacterium]|nr:hypothetical protein [Rickettsiaceae bacterium]
MIKILIATTIGLCIACAITVFQYYKLFERSRLQNIKAINLYLDKKLTNKLMSAILRTYTSDSVQYIIDEIIMYFCLDMVYVKFQNEVKYSSFKSATSNKYFTDSQILDLMDLSNSITDSVGIKRLKHNDKTNVVIFKHTYLTMIVVVEPNHDLTKHEASTIENDIMLLLKIAYLLKSPLSK